MPSRPCLLLLLLVGAGAPAALPACSYNPGRPAAGWTVHDSRNVRLYSSTIVEHEYAQEWLENAYHAYSNSFFKDLKLRPLEAMFLQVAPISATRVFLPNEDPPASWALEVMPGGGQIGKAGLIVLTERRDFKGASRQVAYQLISQAIPNAPVWLRIGFAQYLSEYRVHYKGELAQGKWKVCYGTNLGFLSPSYYANLGGLGSRPQTWREVPGRDVLIPLSEVLGADWYQYARNGRYWFTFTAYAFVSFLIHGRDAWHASRFPLLLKALAEGQSTANALATAYPHLLPEELDEELVNYVRAPRRGVFWQEKPDGLCFAIPPGDHARKKTAASPAPESDVQDALDDLRRLPLWRNYASWYPTEALVSESDPLEHTKLPPRPEKPNAGRTVDQRTDPTRR